MIIFLKHSYRSGIPTFAGLLDIATETFNTPAELDQVTICGMLPIFFMQLSKIFSTLQINQFAKLRESGLGSRTFDQLIERIEANIMWMARYNSSIILWLSQQSKDPWTYASKATRN